jgi:hypothetical protein
MHAFINLRLLSFLVATLLLFQQANSQDVPVQKVKLLVIVNTTSPLGVGYKSEGAFITEQIFSYAISFAVASRGFYIGVPHSFGIDIVPNKHFQKTMGRFNRFEIIRDSVLSAFKPLSDYFLIDIANDRSALQDHQFDLEKPIWKGYDFILFIDEINAGLLTAWQLSTLSATNETKTELYKTATKELMDKHRFIYSHNNKRPYDDAIHNRQAFIEEYPVVVGLFLRALYLQSSYRGKLHQMAATRGFGNQVPSYEHYYNLFSRPYELKVSSPAGWDVGQYPGTQSKFVNPRDRFEAKKYVHGRVDVGLLLKEMKEVVSVDEYADSLIAKLKEQGYEVDEFTQADITIQPGDVKFIIKAPQDVKFLYVIRRYREIYAVVFQFEIKMYFDKYIKEYKGDIESIMQDTKLKV